MSNTLLKLRGGVSLCNDPIPGVEFKIIFVNRLQKKGGGFQFVEIFSDNSLARGSIDDYFFIAKGHIKHVGQVQMMELM